MFVVIRSVFWLTLAYVVIKPGVDVVDAATMSNAALVGSGQVLAAQINTIPCADFTCHGAKALVTAALDAAVLPPTPATAPVPMPRPRPDRAG